MLLSCLAILICLAPIHGYASVLDGIVLSGQGPVLDAEVHAYADYSSLVARQNGLVSTPGEKPGQYRLELPPGKYFLAASGKQDGVELFSFHGVNPVTITADYQWLPFFALPFSPPTCNAGPTSISGLVTFKGKPVNMGTVSAYSTEDTGFRGMGVLTNTLDIAGRFLFHLDPGKYVVIARKRFAETNMGPLQKGDLFCYHPANPIELPPSRSCELEIACYPRDDLDAFLDNPAADPRGRRRTERRDASLWDTVMYESSLSSSAEGVRATLTGTVTDIAGKLRAGLFVQAYPAKNQPLFQMHIIRAITRHMAQTDEKGRYRIDLQPGEYYLVARQRVGEAPERLEYYGLYEGTFNHSINIIPGKVQTEADIVVERIMGE